MSVGIQDALAKLYLKLGGDPKKIKENKNVTDYLDDLADVFKSLIELPIVNSTDNGKVLKVVGGKWNKGDIPSNEPIIVTINSNRIASHGFDELVSAILYGKNVYVHAVDLDDGDDHSSKINNSYLSLESINMQAKEIRFFSNRAEGKSDDYFEVRLIIYDDKSIILNLSEVG